MYIQRFESLCATDSVILVESVACQSALSSALSQRSQQNNSVWRPVDIKSLPNAISEWHEQESFRGLQGDHFLLTQSQELFLWKQAIFSVSGNDIDAVSQLAVLARDAWLLMHSWDLNVEAGKTSLSKDNLLFSRWCKAYVKQCADLSATDYARALVGFHSPRSEAISFLASGFFSSSPIVSKLLERVAPENSFRAGFHPEIYVPHVFESKEVELCEALSWADSISSQVTDARVAIVLKTGIKKNQAIRRCCESVLGPTLPNSQPRYYLFTGDLISAYPPIRIALLALELDLITRWDTLSEFIRHPLLKGAGEEFQERVLLDGMLRSNNRVEIDLRLVVNELRRSGLCPQLLTVLEHVILTISESSNKHSIAEWLVIVEKFLGEIEIGPLYARQGLEKRLFDSWLGCCNELVQLDTLAKPLRRLELYELLKHKVAEKCLSSKPPKDGIFLVSAKEACLIEPTHVWVLEADSETFSSRNKFSALLPLDLQREAQMPFSDPLTTVKDMQKIQGAIGFSSIEHHVSFTNSEGDSRVIPASLFPTLETARVESVQSFRHSNWKRNPVKLESYDDRYGPVLSTREPIKAGVAFFADQSACAFRAFAKHRLRSASLSENQFGISALEKGTVVHQLLAAIWETIKTFVKLKAMNARERLETIQAIVTENFRRPLYGTTVEREIFLIERRRLINLLVKWFDFEASRDIDFEVLYTEHREYFDVFGIPMNVRIDRVDRLKDGQVIVIDYKTGLCSASGWKVPRIEAPQLPIYALFLSSETADDIAFAWVHSEEPKWISGLSKLPDWEEARASWYKEIENLASEIRNGFAMVNPKNGLQTCIYCDQSLFCRIPEGFRRELIEDSDTDE
ncbi:MAG: PD-(D/E)XK nuclease family protein [Gammaproteobacteria bacterium]|nr:PD-(D/E)XK nuclease family protein [Gammaproteobacteria bacterium]